MFDTQAFLNKRNILILDHLYHQPLLLRSDKMLFKLLILSLAAQLAAGVALDYSPKPINLEATELQRRAACAVPGVVNGQCGRYYRGSGCGDQIAAIDPGVSIPCDSLSPS